MRSFHLPIIEVIAGLYRFPALVAREDCSMNILDSNSKTALIVFMLSQIFQCFVVQLDYPIESFRVRTFIILETELLEESRNGTVPNQLTKGSLMISWYANN